MVQVAQQHVVRALVPAGDADQLREELLTAEGLDVHEVEVEVPAKGVYRDERSDRKLHAITVRGGKQALVGGVVGAVIGALVVLVVPYLRDLMLWTLPVMAGGGAYAGALVATARAVEVEESSDDMPDRLYEVTGEDTREQREVTILLGQDRNQVEDLLQSRGYVLLDSRDPKVDGG